MTKIWSIFRRLFLRLHYYCINRFSRNALRTSVEGPIVSLTTYGKRLSSVYLTIESIFSQNCQIAGVYLWLYSKDADNIPKSLQRLIDRGLSIAVVSDDLRSYKKLVYCNQVPDWKCVVTADDDVYYESYWLRSLLDAHHKHPRSVICHRAQVITTDRNGSPYPYSQFQLATSTPTQSTILLPTGVSGILYPRSALTSDIFDKRDFLVYCKDADDIWFRFTTFVAGFGVVLATGDSLNFLPTTFPWSDGLYKQNMASNNDQALTETSRYFCCEDIRQLAEPVPD